MGFKRIKSYFETILNRHREIFQLYTTGLSRKEVERLLKKDTLEALTYYKDRTIFKDRPPEHKSLKSHIEVYRAIFVSFIMQLTPARRLFYILSF